MNLSALPDVCLQSTRERIVTFPNDPTERSPKGDHNRRLALAMDPDVFAAEAGISSDELRQYEQTPPDGEFSPYIAQRVGEALERLEGLMAPLDVAVDNGDVPKE